MAEEENKEEDFSIPEKEDDKNVFTPSMSSFVEQIITHKKLNRTYSGEIIALDKNYAKTSFPTTNEMRVDELGLVHSGFISAAADYAAVMAINQVNTVIIGSKISFLAPAKAGDIVIFEAKVKFEDLRKREIEVKGHINEIKIFQGTFHAVALEKHIFKTKIKNVKRVY